MPENTAGTTDDTPPVGTTNVYFQAWVPFQSGTIPAAGGFGSNLTAAQYQANYGLPSPFAARQLGSFLHLGAIDPEMAKPSTATDTFKQATYLSAQNLENLVTQFSDDYRVRNEQSDPLNPKTGYATPSLARQQESMLLHTKGGWRDHTDGNRITTTAGDKIEVVGGNLVTLILGRPMTDNAFSATDFSNPTNGAEQIHIHELSGTHEYNNNGAPGHIEEIRWIPSKFGSQGTWMVREKTYWSDDISIGSGAGWESFVGTSVELGSGDSISYHGRLTDIPSDLMSNTNFNPVDVHRDEQLQSSSFPYSTDTTVENRIASVTRNAAATFNSGAALAAGTLPALVEQSQNVIEWAVLDSTTSNTTVYGDTSETTNVNGKVSNTTTVGGDVKETTTISGSLVEMSTLTAATSVTTVKGASTEVLAVGGAVTSVTTVGGTITEVSASAAPNTSVSISSAMMGFTACVAQVDVTIAAAEKLDLFIGVYKQEIALCPNAYEYGGDTVKFDATGTISAATALNITAPAITLTGVINLGGPPLGLALVMSEAAASLAKTTEDLSDLADEVGELTLKVAALTV